MKKVIILILCICLLCPLCACGESGDTEEAAWDWEKEPAAASTGVTINVYNWGDYIDDEITDVNAAFTHLTGIEVNYKTFASNEEMYSLISSGAASYDIIVPSDYMVGKMAEEGLLAELNYANIPNYSYIDSAYKGLNYDEKNQYSVPYTWGVVGIFYNSKYVDEADLAKGWGLLWDEKYSGKIFMFDNPRDSFGVAELKLGYSLNETDEMKLQNCYQALVDQKPLVQAYVMDQVYSKMINEEGWIAPYYTGDGMIMMDEKEGNPDIECFIPNAGTNLFVDAFCVPKTAEHQAEAEAYINFLCRPEVALANAEYLGYATPNTEARAQLDSEVADNPLLYPEQTLLDKCEVFLTLPSMTNTLMESLWMRLKK